jgi:hypothetical protein
MRVFISHSEREDSLAQTLRAPLQRAGFDVLDPEEGGGGNLPLAIGKALERAQAMLVLLSPDSVGSGWVQKELEYALGNARFRGRVVPVLVRPTADVPWILRQLHMVDVTHDAPPGAVRKIVDAVKAIPEAA